jgi:hypothetical protein
MLFLDPPLPFQPTLKTEPINRRIPQEKIQGVFAYVLFLMKSEKTANWPTVRFLEFLHYAKNPLSQPCGVFAVTLPVVCETSPSSVEGVSFAGQGSIVAYMDSR